MATAWEVLSVVSGVRRRRAAGEQSKVIAGAFLEVSSNELLCSLVYLSTTQNATDARLPLQRLSSSRVLVVWDVIEFSVTQQIGPLVVKGKNRSLEPSLHQ